MYRFWILICIPMLIFAQGSLMLVGGGGENYGDWSDLPFQWFVEQADSGIIINIDVDETADWYADYFKSFGADSQSRGLRIKEKTTANDSATYKALVEASGIFMEGGDQWDYVSTWKNTLVEDAIKKVFADGGVIGGTSAGLAVLGEVIFDAKYGSSYPDDAATNCRNTDIHLSNGLFDLMPGVLTDSHFHPRGRIGRLVPMMAKWKTDTGEDLVGIGVDEKTAFCIDKNYHGVVYGKASATIIRPTEESVCESVNGQPVKYTNLRFDQLVHGIEYNLNTFEVINSNILQTYNHNEVDYNYQEITINGNDDNSMSAGSVMVNKMTGSATNAWYGRLALASGNGDVPNSVIINKIWEDNDFYENRFVGGLYAVAENPGITAIYLGVNSSINIDANGTCNVNNYAYFIDSRPMKFYGFPQKNDPSSPIPDSNHPAIINARIHFLNDGCEYLLNGLYPTKINNLDTAPGEFKIGQNYPNPFNGETKIQYFMHNPGDVNFQIFDISGKLVDERIINHSSRGNYHFSWKIRVLPTGAYFLKATLAGQTQVIKMMYLK